MLIIGLILMLIGFLTGISLLWILGIILAVIGLVLLLLGEARTGGRRWY